MLINLSLDFDATLAKFTVNGVPFDPPTVPVLLQILSGTYSAQDLLPPGSVYTLPPNKVIEVSIPAGNAAPGGPVSNNSALRDHVSNNFQILPILSIHSICMG